MRGLRWAGLFLAAALLSVPAQAGAAKPTANKVTNTPHSVWTLGMQWPYVAYVSGKDGGHETIDVWNVAKGSTSTVKTSRGAANDAGEIAVAGKRVAWVKSRQLGNTELDHWLYAASLRGHSHLLKRMHGYTGTDCGLGGPQMDGLVGSGSLLAVSTWKESLDGSSSFDQRLNLVTPTGLRRIATGPGAVLSEAADGSHIAVLPLPTASDGPDFCEVTPPTSVSVYSKDGTALDTISLPPPDPSTLGYQLGLSGKNLVVLTTGLYEPNGPAWATLTVYDWTTGALLHTWPVGIKQYPGEVDFQVSGNLAAVEGSSKLHLVDLDTGKDVMIAPASHTDCPPALGPQGLVYALNPHYNGPGRLVFVPTSKLLTLVG